MRVDWHEQIIRMRDHRQSKNPSIRHSFVLLFNHTVAPLMIGIMAVEQFKEHYPRTNPDSGWRSTNLAPIENATSSMQVNDTIVYPTIMVPHGAQMFVEILDSLVGFASQMFGWKAATKEIMPAHPSKFESRGEDEMESCISSV